MPEIRGRITERDLVIPALRAAAQRPGGYISTTDLSRELEEYFQPSGEDAAILDGRRDSRFSQIVRNLKSHKNTRTSMFRAGLATDEPDGLRITDAGRAFVAQVDDE